MTICVRLGNLREYENALFGARCCFRVGIKSRADGNLNNIVAEGSENALFASSNRGRAFAFEQNARTLLEGRNGNNTRNKTKRVKAFYYDIIRVYREKKSRVRILEKRVLIILFLLRGTDTDAFL